MKDYITINTSDNQGHQKRLSFPITPEMEETADAYVRYMADNPEFVSTRLNKAEANELLIEAFHLRHAVMGAIRKSNIVFAGSNFPRVNGSIPGDFSDRTGGGLIDAFNQLTQMAAKKLDLQSQYNYAISRRGGDIKSHCRPTTLL